MSNLINETALEEYTFEGALACAKRLGAANRGWRDTALHLESLDEDEQKVVSDTLKGAGVYDDASFVIYMES